MSSLQCHRKTTHTYAITTDEHPIQVAKVFKAVVPSPFFTKAYHDPVADEWHLTVVVGADWPTLQAILKDRFSPALNISEATEPSTRLKEIDVFSIPVPATDLVAPTPRTPRALSAHKAGSRRSPKATKSTKRLEQLKRKTKRAPEATTSPMRKGRGKGAHGNTSATDKTDVDKTDSDVEVGVDSGPQTAGDGIVASVQLDGDATQTAPTEPDSSPDMCQATQEPLLDEPEPVACTSGVGAPTPATTPTCAAVDF